MAMDCGGSDMDTNIRLEPEKIIAERIASRLGLVQYSRILSRVADCNVSNDKEFQRLFNGYYLVRRNEKWRRDYYGLFESMKTKRPTFESILQALFSMSGNIEASFASKMLATLRTNQPIWDQYVLKRLNLKLMGIGKNELLRNAATLYAEIEDWYARYLSTDECAACVEVFDRYLPNYTWISKVKKLDFFLWSSREETIDPAHH